jgi:hypothetical protein
VVCVEGGLRLSHVLIFFGSFGFSPILDRSPLNSIPVILTLIFQGVRDHIPRFTWQAIGRRLAFILTDAKHYPKPQVRLLP